MAATNEIALLEVTLASHMEEHIGMGRLESLIMAERMCSHLRGEMNRETQVMFESWQVACRENEQLSKQIASMLEKRAEDGTRTTTRSTV